MIINNIAIAIVKEMTKCWSKQRVSLEPSTSLLLLDHKVLHQFQTLELNKEPVEMSDQMGCVLK